MHYTVCTVNHADQRLIAVTCDKCGCNYFFELNRKVEAHGYAIISSDNAEKAAHSLAKDKLNSLLNQDAELVPCPHCPWVNEQLLKAYRECRYPSIWWRNMAIIGIVFVPYILWQIWPLPNPSDDASFFMLCLVAVYCGLVLLTTVGTYWLRSRIRPNKNYPYPSPLPPGTPNAMVLNTAQDSLEIAKPKYPLTEWGQSWVDVSQVAPDFPPLCCNCLDPVGGPWANQAKKSPSSHVAIPYCNRCERALFRKKSIVGGYTALGLTLFATITFFILDVDPFNFWLVTVIGVAVALYGVLTIIAYLHSPVRVRIVDRSRGIARCWFRNADYRKQVDEHRQHT